MPKVFIIILHFNNWADTLQCLVSVQKVSYLNYQIVLVDNGTKEKPKNLNPSVNVIYNEKNLGFAGGNNVGINYALSQGADYVLLLNNDTIVDKDFLTALIKIGQAKKQNGILGPKIYYADQLASHKADQPQKIWFAGGLILPYAIKGIHRGLDETDNGQFDQTEPVDYITGCCMLIKKQVIEKIGLLDEDYFLYYEDADYCWKVKNAGFKSIFVPSAKIWHKGSASSQEGSASYIYYHSRNGLLLIKKNGTALMQLSAYLTSFWILLKQLIKYLFFPKKREWAKNVYLGIKDYYLGKTGPL